MSSNKSPREEPPQTRETPTDSETDVRTTSLALASSKAEILDRHWLEYLKWARQPKMYDIDGFNYLAFDHVGKRQCPPGSVHKSQITSQYQYYLRMNEDNFWRWYIDNKMEAQ